MSRKSEEMGVKYHPQHNRDSLMADLNEVTQMLGLLKGMRKVNRSIKPFFMNNKGNSELPSKGKNKWRRDEGVRHCRQSPGRVSNCWIIMSIMPTASKVSFYCVGASTDSYIQSRLLTWPDVL
jgi:hypothetical protein